jgi:peroxiredoxin
MEILPAVHRLGASILTVTPQLPDRAVVLRKEANLAFPILFDEGNAVARQWGLDFTFPDDLRELYTSWNIDLQVENGDDSWTLALPASFVIDGEGVIRYRYVNTDYRFRPEPSEAYLPVLGTL